MAPLQKSLEPSIPPERNSCMVSKDTRGYRLAIVNPMTLVGSELKTLLHEQGLDFQKVTLLASSEEERGSVTEVLNEPALVQPISASELEDCDLVFFCGSAEDNQPWIETHRAAQFIAIDLSQPSIVDGMPVVAGVNSGAVNEDASVIVSPHPAATPLILLLNAIRQASPIELCVATVIQPASEKGQAGIDELLGQTISVLNAKSISKDIFGRQLAFTLYPSPEATRDELYVADQVRAALGDPHLHVSVSLAQGSVFHGHTFSVFVKCGSATDRSRIVEAINASGSLEIMDEDDPASTIEAAGRDEVLIGRIKDDPYVEGGFTIWMVADNLRRSTALNAVLVAEDLLARFRLIAN